MGKKTDHRMRDPELLSIHYKGVVTKEVWVKAAAASDDSNTAA